MKKNWSWSPLSKKRTSKSNAEDRLWKIFSKFVRMRDANNAGYCKCITCGAIHHWKEMDAGHFISRNHKGVKFHEANSNAQCAACNRFQSGKQFEHGQAIDRKYGKGAAEILLNLSKMPHHASAFDYEFKIKHYRQLVKEMEQQNERFVKHEYVRP